MGSHDPFKYLKHKLWPIKGPGVKLIVWFPTTKSLESPWFPCMEVACNIPLEIFQWWLQFCFRPYLNRRFVHKVMGLQSYGNFNFENFETPTWESWDKNDILVLAPWPCTENTIKGKVVFPPKFGPWWFLWIYVCSWFVRVCSWLVCVCSWLVHAPKVF
jgi:hypothetical protein